MRLCNTCVHASIYTARRARAAPATPAAPPQADAELAAQLLALWRTVITRGGVGSYAIFEELDLTLTQVKALCALSDAELTVKDLAERLGLSLPGASRAVDALVARELIARREDAVDRRMKRLRCTAAGADALERLDEARLAGLEQFTTTLPRRSAPAALAAPCGRSSTACRRGTHDEASGPQRRQPPLVDARGDVLRAVHDHARQHGRERRAAVDPARPAHARSPAWNGRSTRTCSRSACCS